MVSFVLCAVSERENQKRDPGDQGIIEEQLQNILPEVREAYMMI